ncbi:MAG: type IV pilus modification protein PilV [Candidatus Sedimenticola sp. 20ELBAFRAG]
MVLHSSSHRSVAILINDTRSAEGFTLIEVLVTLVVLSVGLLGLAGLQGGSLQSNRSAYLRTQASVLAYDLIDRMRSNPGGSYAGFSTDSAPEGGDCQGSAKTCTVTELANYDKARWATELARLLPGGSGSVGRDPGGIEQVVIKWTGLDGEMEMSVPISL